MISIRTLGIKYLLTIIVFFASCTTKQDNIKTELTELVIKDTSVKHRNEQEKTQNFNTYFIKALVDSTYTGDVEERYSNGIVKYKGFYRFGKRHGEWLYFYENGNLWSECVYNRGKIHGKSNVYYPNGKLYYSAFYKNDLKDSVWTYFDSSGNVKKIEFYKNGHLVKQERK